ncbi:MAG TPA: MFS transporter [Gaiellaceae bacterium]|jgi:MFS family permease
MRLSRAWLGGLALALSAGWNISNVGAVADELAGAYGVSLGVIGLFTTALFVTHAAVQVPAGRLCDRYGARLVGIAGLSVTAAASAATLAWREAAFAIAMRVLAGVGTGVTFVAGSDYVRSTVGSAVAQGVYGAGSMAGGGVALALVPQWSSWRVPFASAVVVAGVGAAVLALAPREAPRPPVARALPSFRDARLVRFAAMHSASFGLSVVIGNWVVTLLERNGDVSSGVAGAAGALTLLLGIVTRPLGGRLAGRVGVLRASFLLGGAATALLAVAHPLPLAVGAAALVGLAAGIPFAPAFAGAARARPEAPAAAVGLVNMTAAVTILVVTPLVGLTFALPGDGRIGFAAVGVLWALAAVTVRPNGR